MADPTSDPDPTGPTSGDQSARQPVAAAHPPAGAATGTVVQIDVRTSGWVVAFLLLGFAVFAIARNAEGMLTRVLIGVILALALDGVVQRLRTRFGLRRSAAVGIVGAALLVLAMLILLVLGPPAVSQAREFSREIPETVEKFYDLPLVGDTLRENDASGRVQEWIRDLPANISDEAIADTANRLLGGVFSIIVVVFTTFAVLLDGERLVNRGRRLLPVSARDEADRIARALHRTIGKYFGGSLTVAALMGLYVLTIGLIFDVPLAPLAAIWAMFTSLIPQIGGFLGGSFLFVLSVSNSVTTALIVITLFIIYMNVENHFISPAIVGNAVNLTPPSTMLAAFIGGAVAGVPGALVATPLVGASKQLYLEFRYGHEPPERGGRNRILARITGLLKRLARPKVTPPPTAVDPLIEEARLRSAAAPDPAAPESAAPESGGPDPAAPDPDGPGAGTAGGPPNRP